MTDSSTGTPKADKQSKSIKYGKDSGRVKVFVRVRPFIKDEEKKKLAYELSLNQPQIKTYADDRGHAEKTYTFDHVFPPNESNEQVCKILTDPIMQAATNGFNGTLIAYGQTGSGKTYTLMSENGITRTLINRCFNHIQEDVNHHYKINVSYLQIYQEKIYDLLNAESKNDLTIRESPKTGVYVENMSEYVVRSPAEVLQFITTGKKKLVFAETKMNRTSSRSHAVFIMSIERKLIDDPVKVKTKKTDKEGGSNDLGLNLDALGKDVIIKGKIHICDLAGSERIKRTGASGERLSEAQHINSSLLELGNVIAALADENASHVPFRNSVLTRLLQESLGGNCKTNLVVCISPSIRDLHESKCTLGFGQRAMKVKNTAYVNMEVDFKSLADQLLKQLNTKDEEIQAIRDQTKDEVAKACQSLKEEFDQLKLEHQEEIDKLAQKHEHDMFVLHQNIIELESELALKTAELAKSKDSVFSLGQIIAQQAQLERVAREVESYLSKECMATDKQNYRLDMQRIFALYRTFARHLVEVESMTSPSNNQMVSLLEALKIQVTVAMEKREGAGSESVKVMVDQLRGVAKQLREQLAHVDNLHQGNQDNHIVFYQGFACNVLRCVINYADAVCHQATIVILRGENEKYREENERLNTREMKVGAQTHDISTQSEHLTYNDFTTQVSIDRTPRDVVRQDGQKDEWVQGLEECIEPVTSSNIGQSVVSIEQCEAEKSEQGTSAEKSINGATNVDKGNSSLTSTVVKEEVTVENIGGSPKKILTTTLENQERIVTEIATEDIIDKDDNSQKKIFNNFGSTLDRIEGLVRLDRQLKLQDAMHKFDGRSKSALDDDRFGASLLASSRYSYYPTSVPAYTESMELYRNSRQPTQENEARKYVSLEVENKQLENNCRALEMEIEGVRNESKEYLKLLQDITHINAFTSHISDFKRQVREKCIRIPQSTQTTDTLETRRDLGKSPFSQTVKVAHIKPLLNKGDNAAEFNKSSDSIGDNNLSTDNVLRNNSFDNSSFRSNSFRDDTRSQYSSEYAMRSPYFRDNTSSGRYGSTKDTRSYRDNSSHNSFFGENASQNHSIDRTQPTPTNSSGDNVKREDKPSDMHLPTSVLNLSYDMNENNVLSNISSVSTSDKNTNGINKTPSTRRQGWQKPYESRDKFDSMTGYSHDVFTRLRGDEKRPHRPQTWYGIPDTSSSTFAREGLASSDSYYRSSLRSNERYRYHERNTNV